MAQWKHRLTNIDKERRTANCSNCGDVKVKRNGSNSYRCRVAVNIERKKNHKFKYPEGTVCEICGGTSRIAFDHDHASGDFRGWLCGRCNLTLGMVKDDITVLKGMITYLNK